MGPQMTMGIGANALQKKKEIEEINRLAAEQRLLGASGESLELMRNQNMAGAKKAAALQAKKDFVAGKGGMSAGQGAAIANLGVGAAQSLGALGTAESGSTVGGTLGGAASGAATGAMVGGVPGAIVGGAVGGLSGAMKAKSARRKMRAAAEAEKEEKKSKIMGDKEARVQRAMQSMAANMGATLRSVG